VCVCVCVRVFVLPVAVDITKIISDREGGGVISHMVGSRHFIRYKYHLIPVGSLPT